MATPTQRQEHYLRAVALLRDANDLWAEIYEKRKAYGDRYGDHGFPNPYPISAGLCAHWPDDAKNDVRQSVRLAGDVLNLAHKHWKAAGKRDHTFRRECHGGRYPHMFPA